METNISPKTYDLINHYFGLKIGNKQIKTPYYINSKHKKGELRSLIGKGTPDEIEDEVKIWAKVRNFDLDSNTEIRVRKFMAENSIGIDCSGLVSHILNIELKERGVPIRRVIRNDFNKDFLHKIYHKIRYLDNLDVETLSDPINSRRINNLLEVVSLDMLHLKGLHGGYHVAIVIKTCYNVQRKYEIYYVHSSRWYSPNDGIRYGKITVTDPNNDLSFQSWEDSDANGINYIRQEFVNEKKEGYFFRLKRL